VTAEEIRLEETKARRAHWQRWGPYLSERAWGTGPGRLQPRGTAWEYLPHDHARSKAYRWNEDGLSGICDRHQHICFAIALWNGSDPILKERLFGLTGNELTRVFLPDENLQPPIPASRYDAKTIGFIFIADFSSDRHPGLLFPRTFSCTKIGANSRVWNPLMR
jgi:hypothetical protein